MKRVLGVILFGMSSLAFGQGYVGGGLGSTSVSMADCGIQGFSCGSDDKSTGFKLFAGREFAKHFAVEGGYVNLGQFTQTANGSINGTQVTARGTIDASGVFADALFIAPISSTVSVFGRLGLMVWNVSAKAQASGGGRSVSDSQSASGVSPDYGVGIQIAVTPKIQLRGEAQRFAKVGDNATTGQSDVDLISASVLYRF